MKNFLTKTLVLFFIISSVLTNVSTKNSFAFPTLYAEGIYLMDSKTGQVLFEQNANTPYAPASTTKVMTAIVALENSNLTDQVTIGEKPPLADGTSIGIAQGEVYTMEELLLGLMLESGNDCADAIAEYIAGSNAAFAELMNSKAKEIGCTNTTFKNPSGLPEDGHLTTARDLALIMDYALDNEDFIRISRTPSSFFENHPFSDGSEKWVINKNHLLKEGSPYKYEYAYSGKTGYTTAANHCYTAAAIKDNQTLVSAFLNATDKDGLYTSVGQLFDWGFENFKTEKIVSKGEKLADYNLDEATTIPLLATEDVYYTLSTANGQTADNVTKSVSYKDRDLTTSSIKKDEVLFNASLLVNGSEFTKMNLASGIDREYTSELKAKNTLKEITDSKYFIPSVVVGVIIIILIILLLLRIRYVKRRRKFLRRKYNIRNKYNF